MWDESQSTNDDAERSTVVAIAMGCIGKEGDLNAMRFYNGFTAAEISGAYGLKKLGIETDLIRDQVYEFAYIFVPVPLKGTTGSPGSPIAVR